MWTDIVLAGGSTLFVLALVPTLVDAQARVPWLTSVLTASVLWSFLSVYASYGLWASFVATALLASAWTFVAIYRRGPKVVVYHTPRLRVYRRDPATNEFAEVPP